MDFSDFISQPAVIWFLIGLTLMLLEFGIPGLIVIFFGIGAWITALACLLFEPSINFQLILFITTSFLSLLLLRKNFKKIFVGNKEDNVDDTVEDFIGKTAIADTKIALNKRGKIIFKGTQWEADSDETIEKDSTVEIIGKDSIVLKVKNI